MEGRDSQYRRNLAERRSRSNPAARRQVWIRKYVEERSKFVRAQFRQFHPFRLFAEYSVLDSSSLHFVLVGRQSIAGRGLRRRLLSSIATVRSTLTDVSLVVPRSLRWLAGFRHTGICFLEVVTSPPAEAFHFRFHSLGCLKTV